MLIGVVGGLIEEGVERESDSLGALRASMVTATVGLVADVLELAVCSVAKSSVEISTEGRGVEVPGWKCWYYREGGRARKRAWWLVKDERAGLTSSVRCRLGWGGHSYDMRCSKGESPLLGWHCIAAR